MTHAGALSLSRPTPTALRCAASGRTPTRAAVRAGMPRFLQAKLPVSQPGDPYEQEADRVADHVMRMPTPAMQRQCAGCAGDEWPCPTCTGSPRIERKPDGASGSEAAGVSNDFASHLGPGQALDDTTRAFFEPRFERDLAQVRVHTGAKGQRSAQRIHASAYTVGADIVFGADRYGPNNTAGRHLLAHELTHVVQQGGVARQVQRVSTQDCESADTTLVEASHNRAIALVNAAIARLTADPVTTETQAHFANHFGGYGSTRRDVVVAHYRRDLELLTANDMTYECESECDDGEPAYTYWVFGDIHVCLPWLRTQGLTERGETFVHEMHHWDVPRGHLDLGYHANNADAHTSWVVAVNNADAYSELAQDLYEQP